MSDIKIPSEVRAGLADTIEEMGSAMCLLRESVNDSINGNIPGAILCASDALEIISSLETRFSQLSARLAIFTDH